MDKPQKSSSKRITDAKAYREGLGPRERERYKEKLRFVGGDPYELAPSSWCNDDQESLPSIAYPDIVNYLVFSPSPYTAEDLKSYKGLEAYNQMVCGWVRELQYQVINDRCVVKARLLVELNPGASSPPPGGDLLHVRAVGNNDTLHFLFCSQGAPTLLLVHTNSSSSMVKVNWTQFTDRHHSGGLQVEPESSVLYSTAIVFSRLLEYDDVNDTSVPVSSSQFFPPYELQDFSWSRLNLSGDSALLCGSAPNATNGSVCLQLSVFESVGRGHTWPRLLHTANSSQVGVWLDGLLPRATRSRFLLELQSVGGAYPLSRVEVIRSIDDEYTPSIFQVSQWLTSENVSSDVLGFVQWKPVAYRQVVPALEDATPCRHSEPRPQSGEEVASSSALIQAFYAEPLSFGLNVSFGLGGEPFYNSTKFLSWTLLLGSGVPPVDSFSPLVLSLMAFGLGTPMMLLLLGGVCVCVRKRAAATAATYEPIN